MKTSTLLAPVVAAPLVLLAPDAEARKLPFKPAKYRYVLTAPEEPVPEEEEEEEEEEVLPVIPEEEPRVPLLAYPDADHFFTGRVCAESFTQPGDALRGIGVGLGYTGLLHNVGTSVTLNGHALQNNMQEARYGFGLATVFDGRHAHLEIGSDVIFDGDVRVRTEWRGAATNPVGIYSHGVVDVRGRDLASLVGDVHGEIAAAYTFDLTAADIQLHAGVGAHYNPERFADQVPLHGTTGVDFDFARAHFFLEAQFGYNNGGATGASFAVPYGEFTFKARALVGPDGYVDASVRLGADVHLPFKRRAVPEEPTEDE